MMRKNKKIVRNIIYIVLLLAILGVIFYLFKNEKGNKGNSDKTVGLVVENTILPTPDRIIYKNQKNEYIILNADESEYSEIYSELYNRVTNIIEGKVYSEQEITEMQKRGSFIELDYNTKSKNFVFMLEEEGVGIIKRFSDTGQVIKNSLDDTYSLIKKMDKLTKDKEKYNFDERYSYDSENRLTEIPYDLPMEQVKDGVYQKIINYGNNYRELLDNLHFKIDTEINNIDLEKQNIVITVSRYEIKDITTNIGNIKYDFGEFLNEYIVNVLVVSKVVNTNCIYYNITSSNDMSAYNTNIVILDEKEHKADYFVEDEKYYAIVNHEKVAIISMEEAADIADNEAKDDKYQYQGWKSEFYARGKNNDDDIVAELILSPSDNNRYGPWNEEWKKTDDFGVVMWRIRLFDENDPLTSLYIYINAANGEVIGAGGASD